MSGAAWISVFMIPQVSNSYWFFRSRTGLMNQAKQQGSIFTKGASLATKMDLQTQPNPFQGQLDWPLVLIYFLQKYLGLDMKVVIWANCPLSSFPESFISPLCFLHMIEQNVVLRLFSVFIEVKLPEAQAIFSKPVLGRNAISACMILFIPASTSDCASLLGYRGSCTYFSVLAFCVVFFYLLSEGWAQDLEMR